MMKLEFEIDQKFDLGELISSLQNYEEDETMEWNHLALLIEHAKKS